MNDLPTPIVGHSSMRHDAPKFLPTALTMTLLLLALMAGANADETAWIGVGANATWTNPNNWTGKVLPNPDIDARIESGQALLTAGGVGSTRDLYLNSASYPNSVSISIQANFPGTATGTLTSRNAYLGLSGTGLSGVFMTDPGSNWTLTGDLIAGYAAKANLQISDRAAVSSGRGFLGDAASGHGTFEVYGDGSIWNAGSELRVGNAGEGVFYVVFGGAAINTLGFIGYHPGSLGSAEVTGAGSTWDSGELTVGYQSERDNVLLVRDGGAVSSDRGFIGDFQGAVGRVTVQDPDSTWTLGSELRVGNVGKGTLNVLNGADVTNGLGYVGRWDGSTGAATVSGAGSTWTNTGDLIVGYQSTANNLLTVKDGGKVTSARGFLGDYGPGAGPFGTAVGNVTVTGAGSGWNIGTELHVGNFGKGALKIENGGTVWSSRGRVGVNSGAHGTVQVSGPTSNWYMGADLFLGGSGDGSLVLGNGGTVTASGGVTISTRGEVAGNGRIVAFTVTNHGLLHPGPPISPGLSDSTLYIEGNYLQQSSGKLQIDLDTGDHGRINVNGHVALAGTLEVNHIVGLPFWNPEVGDSFNILDWTGTLTGTFDSIQLPTLSGPREWDYSQLYTNGVLSVVAPGSVTADFDGDGNVDGADLGRWKSGFAVPGGAEPDEGDANGDGLVDGADFLAWQRQVNFGGAGSSVVPEPTALALVAACVGSALKSARRRRRDAS